MSTEKFRPASPEDNRPETDDEFAYDVDEAEAAAILLGREGNQPSPDASANGDDSEPVFPETDIGFDKAEAEAIGYKSDVAEIRSIMILAIRKQLDDLNRKVQQSSNLSANEFSNIEKKVDELETALRSLENAEREEQEGRKAVNKSESAPTTPSTPNNETAGDDPETPPNQIGDEGAGVLRAAAIETPKTVEKKTGWQWLKQRMKGLASFGWTDFHAAEKFRSVTKGVGAVVAAESVALKQTKDMDLAAAQTEAETIRQMAAALGGDVTAEDLSLASEQVDQEKALFNARLITKIVDRAEGQIRDRLVSYNDDFNNAVASPEKLALFRVELEKALRESTVGLGDRGGKIVKKEIDFKRELRNKLDSKYWRRYLYAGFDAGVATSLAALSYIYVTADSMTGLSNFINVGPGQPLSPENVPGLTDPSLAKQIPNAVDTVPSIAAENFSPMKDTIWNTAKEWMTSHGMANPSDVQLLEVSKQVAADSHIAVAEWGTAGDVVDRTLQQGHLLNFRGASDLIAKMTVK